MATVVNPRLASGQRVIALRELSNQVYGIGVQIPNATAAAVSRALNANIEPLTRSIYDGIRENVFTRTEMRKANQEIARRAQGAMVAGWKERLPLKSGPYRAGSDPQHDRLVGALGEALAEGSMTKGTSDRTISFLNFNRLNHDARHWYRVNYGAFGPKASVRRPVAHPVTVGGHTVFMLQDEMQPAPNSWLPRRFQWADNAFIPKRGPADVHGGGVRAALFTDLGFKALADNVDPVYREMLSDALKSNKAKPRYKAKV
jgi:hypothetical protein